MGHLKYIKAIWYILLPFGNGVVIWYSLLPFVKGVVIWYTLPRFGKLRREKNLATLLLNPESLSLDLLRIPRQYTFVAHHTLHMYS
jgi:hypothetical protein